MALYLVRHGQTDWNLAKRFQSRTDVPLNETGRTQAARIGDALRDKALRFDCVRSSPLGRARETAEIVCAAANTTVSVDANLVELSLGEFEGQFEADLMHTLGDKFGAWRAGCFTQAAPGGESIFQGMERAAQVLAGLAEVEASGNALIVAHQGMNMAIMASLSGRSDVQSLNDFKQANDQVEVWDTQLGQRIERFVVS